MLMENLKKRQVFRLSLIIIMAFCLLSLTLVFAPAPRAHADNCVIREGYTTVYDSYGHNEGTVSLHYNACNFDVWGTFLSNNNTWQSVYVYTEPTTPGYKETTYTTWIPNYNFNAPSYQLTIGSCYYAEVGLIDNRGNWNWYGTSDTCGE